jgi:hypothetical protein
MVDTRSQPRSLTSLRHPDGSVSIESTPTDAPNDPPFERHELRVLFDPTGGQVVGVQLTMPGITPTVLHRFPWRRWLALAEVERRALDLTSSPKAQEMAGYEASEARTAFLRGDPIPKRWDAAPSARPGRKGHPADKYESVAKRYLGLVREGVYNPTATIAKEESVSRNTAAGWVAKARQLGYLPKGRPGKAG